MRWSRFNLKVREHPQCCLQEAGRVYQRKDLYVPGFLYVFSLSSCYWTPLKKDAGQEESLV